MSRFGLLAIVMLLVLPVVPAQAAEPAAPADFHPWRGVDLLVKGQRDGLVPGLRGLRIGRPAGTVEHTEPQTGTRTYEYGTWTSPSYRPGFDATQLVASWNATTPKGTWLRVDMRGRTTAGAETIWYGMGQWASGDSDVTRTSLPGQSDDYGYIDVDTFVGKTTLRAYQLRVTLYRAKGTHESPTLSMAGAMTSAIPDRFSVPTSGPGGAWGIELPVRPYSQNIHIGQYPEYGGGGEAWCSPTSTQMVVEYWGKRPSKQDLSWVAPSYADPSVDHAARYTYDKDYDGTGNWPFNTAYAATYGLNAHVTRLRSLTELEGYIKRGIPVITSQSFLASELDGAGYGTSGHIMVVIGFTRTGDVIVNDPASSSNSEVRNVYKRAQFENIWQRTKRYRADGTVAGGPGGVAYIITR
ncbi:MAG: C39 family peptidase [Kibdelosporangium sp.]